MRKNQCTLESEKEHLKKCLAYSTVLNILYWIFINEYNQKCFPQKLSKVTKISQTYFFFFFSLLINKKWTTHKPTSTPNNQRKVSWPHKKKRSHLNCRIWCPHLSPTQQQKIDWSHLSKPKQITKYRFKTSHLINCSGLKEEWDRETQNPFSSFSSGCFFRPQLEPDISCVYWEWHTNSAAQKSWQAINYISLGKW